MRLDFIKGFIKEVMPEYREMLSQIEKNGCHFQIHPSVNLIIERLKIENYPELYRDEAMLNKMVLLGVMPAHEINEISARILTLNDQAKVVAQEDFIRLLAESSREITDSLPASEEQMASTKGLFDGLNPEEQRQAILQAQITLSGFIPTFYQLITMMVHGRKLTDLVKAAESGDDEAFCLAIQMDKRILSLEYFRQRRDKAELNQEVDFLKTLSYRLTNPLFRGKIRYKTLWLTFAILDTGGFLTGSLKLRELLDFCEEVGVVGLDNNIQDESALGKRLREYRQFQKINNRSRL